MHGGELYLFSHQQARHGKNTRYSREELEKINDLQYAEYLSSAEPTRLHLAQLAIDAQIAINENTELVIKLLEDELRDHGHPYKSVKLVRLYADTLRQDPHFNDAPLALAQELTNEIRAIVNSPLNPTRSGNAHNITRFPKHRTKDL